MKISLTKFIYVVFCGCGLCPTFRYEFNNHKSEHCLIYIEPILGVDKCNVYDEASVVKDIVLQTVG